MFAWACPPSHFGATCSRGLAHRSSPKSERRWAHQDSNLERAGYEPAALTVELWARIIVPRCRGRPWSALIRTAPDKGLRDRVRPLRVTSDDLRGSCDRRAKLAWKTASFGLVS